MDGVPGWLVIFGVEYLKDRNFEKAIQRTFEIARGLVIGELKELKQRSPRYVEILKSIPPWLQVKPHKGLSKS